MLVVKSIVDPNVVTGIDPRPFAVALASRIDLRVRSGLG